MKSQNQQRMYQEKLKQLRSQLEQLEAGTLPEYKSSLQALEEDYNDRLNFNSICKACERERIEREHLAERERVQVEVEERKFEIKENLIVELEEKRRQIEYEYQTMDLSGDSGETKAAPKRNLRRRQNEPPATTEKRPNNRTVKIQYSLAENEVQDDLAAITEVANGNDNLGSVPSSLSTLLGTS